MDKINRRSFLKISGGIAVSIPFLKNIKLPDPIMKTSTIKGRCQVMDIGWSTDGTELFIQLDKAINLSEFNGTHDFILGESKAFEFYGFNNDVLTDKLWVYALDGNHFNGEKLKGQVINYKIVKRG